MALPNPFLQDVCVDPYAVREEDSVQGMNADLLERLVKSVDEEKLGEGSQRKGQPLMLLTAPRAGYGKTHLLGRMTAAAGVQWVMVPLAFRSGDEVVQRVVVQRGVEALERAESGREGWSRLRQLCGGVVTSLLRRLISTGRVPCANPEQAVRVLSGDCEEVFEAGGSAHLIGEWLRRHSDQLLKPLAEEASRSTGLLTPEEAEQWLALMLAQADEGEGAGLAALHDILMADDRNCRRLFRLVSVWRTPVLMVDHVDAYYRNAEAGLQLASLLLDLAELEGVPVVLSLNQDVWQATFGHHLPSALEDRMTASRLLLRGLSESNARSMVQLRLQDSGANAEAGASFLQFLDVGRYFMGRPLGSVSARVFLRHAAQQWEAFVHSASEAAPSQQAGPEEPGSEAPGILPLIGEETGPVEPLQMEGSVFDPDADGYMKKIAADLAEPQPALPQDGKGLRSSPFSLGPQEGEAATDEAGAEPEGLIPDEQDPMEPPPSGETPVKPTPGNFEKLRMMLDRLRSNGPAQVAAGAAAVGAVGVAAGASAAKEPSAEGGINGTASADRASLIGRFEALRMQMTSEAEARPLDGVKVTELIRLAGRRFPLVQFSEDELPGLPDRSVIRWRLKGLEILFAPVGEVELRFWQTLASYAVGCATASQQAAAAVGEAAPEFKIVVFKSDREEAAWRSFRDGSAFPEPLTEWIDEVHLDTRSVASLYAMQRIIREAETGVLEVEPQQVMSVLARELDFFWKRITRQSSVTS